MRSMRGDMPLEINVATLRICRDTKMREVQGEALAFLHEPGFGVSPGWREPMVLVGALTSLGAVPSVGSGYLGIGERSCRSQLSNRG